MSFHIHSSIPVLRMLNEAKAKAFYCDYLGFEIEWEHRFNDNPESPLYMQVKLGEAVLHLDGHAGEDAPVSQVRIPVEEIEAFVAELATRVPDGGESPALVDPRYEGVGTDLNLLDPSGNLVVFWRLKNA